MKHFKNLKIVVISVLFTFCFAFAHAQQNYVNQHLRIAKELSKQYAIPSSVILAIAIVETGAGTSKGSKAYNNHFGIVGKNTVSNSRYKSFSSVRESYEEFCKMITRKKYYAQLKGSDDHSDWIRAIASAGYSTQPQEWMRRVKMVISKIHL
mgnify:CR=1 FL=1